LRGREFAPTNPNAEQHSILLRLRWVTEQAEARVDYSSTFFRSMNRRSFVFHASKKSPPQ
jgi:hypothetical protein